MLRARPEPAPEPPTADLGAEKIVESLASYGVGSVLGRQEAPTLVRYKLKLGPGTTFRRVHSNAVNLRIHLALAQDPLISAGPGCVFVDVLRDRPEVVPWSRVGRLERLAPEASPLAFAAGVRGRERRAHRLRSGRLDQAHALVAGVAGGGKSEFLKSILASLLHRNTPESLRFTLIDPKRVTFGNIRESPFLSAPVIFDVADASASAAAADDMDQRYDQLLAESLVKLSDPLARGSARHPPPRHRGG